MNHRYLDEGRGSTCTVTVRLTADDLMALQAQVNTPALADRPIYYAFFDFAEVSDVDISSPQLRGTAQHAVDASQFSSVRRIVAIHAKHGVPFGLGRIWEVFIRKTGWECDVFRDRSQAVAWLRARALMKFGIQIELE